MRTPTTSDGSNGTVASRADWPAQQKVEIPRRHYASEDNFSVEALKEGGKWHIRIELLDEVARFGGVLLALQDFRGGKALAFEAGEGGQRRRLQVLKFHVCIRCAEWANMCEGWRAEEEQQGEAAVARAPLERLNAA